MILDVWLHYHSNGVDVYPIFRDDDSDVSCEDDAVREVNVASEFEPNRFEYVELALSGVTVPIGGTA